MTVRKSIALFLALTGCSGEDPDLAGAKSVSFGGSTITQATANSNAGQSLRRPAYLPAWGPYFPDSLVGSKLVQTWPDGRSHRATMMVAFVPYEQVVGFYRDAIAAAQLPAEPNAFSSRGTIFELGGGNGYKDRTVLIQNQSWTEGSGKQRHKVEIQVMEPLPTK